MTQPKSYLQTDPRWAGIDYSAPGERCNIGNAGCGPTSAAMLIVTYVDSDVTPETAAKWALQNGYKAANQGTYHSFFAAYGKQYGLFWTQINTANLRGLNAADSKPYHDKALQAVRDGKAVIACMGPDNWTKGGHYILWYGVAGDDVLINDPASVAAGRTRNKLALLQKEVKYYFVCDVPVKSEMTFEVACDKLEAAGVMNPASYWKARKGIDPHFEGLVRNMAGRV